MLSAHSLGPGVWRREVGQQVCVLVCVGVHGDRLLLKQHASLPLTLPPTGEGFTL